MPSLIINRLRMRYISGGLFFCFLPECSILREINLNCEAEYAKMGRISAVSGVFRPFGGPLLDVEGDGEEGEVHCDLVFAEVSEAPVCHVVFHLPEHGLGLYRSF